MSRNQHTFVLGVLLCATSACTRNVQAWPPPVTTDTPVIVRLSQPRTIAFEGVSSRDSVPGVQEIRGNVVSLAGNTLVVRVTAATGDPAGADRLVGHQATILLDASTVVTRRELDGWKVGYGVLAGGVLAFAALVTLGN